MYHIPSVSSEKRNRLIEELWQGIIKTLRESELDTVLRKKFDLDLDNYVKAGGTLSLRSLKKNNPLFKMYHE